MCYFHEFFVKIVLCLIFICCTGQCGKYGYFMHPAASLIDKNFVKTTLFKPKDVSKELFSRNFLIVVRFFFLFFFTVHCVFAFKLL